MSAPSVLFINRVYPPAHGATGRVLRDLARAFAAEGWAVTVLTTGPQAGQEKDHGVLVKRIKARQSPKSGTAYMWIWLKLFFSAWGMARRDLIVSLSDPPLLVVLGNMIARQKGAEHIHWCHDLYPDLLPALKVKISKGRMAWLKKKSRRAMKRCSRVIVVGRCMAKTLTHSGVETARVSVVPNWPPPELYANMPDSQTPPVHFDEADRALRQKFKVMYAGNLGRAHPVTPILDAAEKLKDHPEIELIFVGDSPGHERLAAERDRRGLKNIRFLPYQPINRLRSTLEQADIHLVTVREEAGGLLVPCKFYSALAVARPVIYMGPAETEIARILKDYKAGLSVPSADSDALAHAILSLRQDSALWTSCQSGAAQAGDVLTPGASIAAWGERAAQTAY